MKYFKVDEDKFIEYNEETKQAQVYSKSDLQKQLAFNQAQLTQLGSPSTDKDLLAWAKENYPYKGETQSRELITKQITDLISKLEGMK